MNIDKRFYFIAFTTEGRNLVKVLTNALNSSLSTNEVVVFDKKKHVSAHDFIHDVFEVNEIEKKACLIIVGAVGIAVRLIAPFIKDKLTDPPVIAIDDLGFFVISLLSGHVGGANHMTEQISQILKEHHYSATAVITTATDIRGLRGIESLLTDYKVPLTTVRDSLKKLNMHVAEGGVIYVAVDPLLGHHHSETACIKNYHSSQKLLDKDLVIAITLRCLDSWLILAEDHHLDQCFISKSLVIGTGCKKNFPSEVYMTTLMTLLESHQFELHAIQALSSVSIKKQEICIFEAAKYLESEVVFHDVNELKDVAMSFEVSDFVLKTIGIGSVAGPSALKLTGDEMAMSVYKQVGCTFSFGRTLR